MIDWQKLREVNARWSSDPWSDDTLVEVMANLFGPLLDIAQAADGYDRHLSALTFGPPFPPVANGDQWRARIRVGLARLAEAVEQTP